MPLSEPLDEPLTVPVVEPVTDPVPPHPAANICGTVCAVGISCACSAATRSCTRMKLVLLVTSRYCTARSWAVVKLDGMASASLSRSSWLYWVKAVMRATVLVVDSVRFSAASPISTSGPPCCNWPHSLTLPKPWLSFKVFADSVTKAHMLRASFSKA